MNESTQNEKSAPRKSVCIILMHRAADRNDIRVVYGYCKHRSEQDSVR